VQEFKEQNSRLAIQIEQLARITQIFAEKTSEKIEETPNAKRKIKVVKNLVKLKN
jgi:hypothetical protein